MRLHSSEHFDNNICSKLSLQETASEVDDNSDDFKGGGGTKGDEKLIDSKSFNTLKESNLHKLPSSKLGQTTPTNMHRSVVQRNEINYQYYVR